MKRIAIAAFSGLVATIPMTFAGWLGPAMGLPRLSTPELLAGWFHMGTGIGWAAHFGVGAALAIGYALVAAGFPIASLLAGHSRRNSMVACLVMGAVYGIVPFMLSQLVVLPMMGAALTAGGVVLSLLAHLAYGTTLAFFYDALADDETLVAKNGPAEAVHGAPPTPSAVPLS